jgi:peroxiredoxin
VIAKLEEMGKMLAAGAEVPDVRLALLEGGAVSLREEGPVLLAFFKISCPVCQLTLPYLNRIHLSRRVLGVSQNAERDTREFVEHFRLSYPILLDPERRYPASNAFGITHVPTIFDCGPDARIARVIEGWNKKEMEALGAVIASDNVPAWKAG